MVRSEESVLKGRRSPARGGEEARILSDQLIILILNME